MDPIDSINPKKDTTFAFMIEAQKRGFQLEYMELKDLQMSNGEAEANMSRVKVIDNAQSWFELEDSIIEPLNSLDVILMRKDPPYDIEYIMATYILERAQSQGVLVMNDPRSLRDANEKVFATFFPQCCPPNILTRSISSLFEFLEKQESIVLKPTDKMGGQSVFVVAKGDLNAPVLFEEMTRKGTRFIQAQSYIPEIQTSGDKRILLIDGEPIEKGITRIPGLNDHRGNLSAGAQCHGLTLTERDLWICKQIGPDLKRMGLQFVGIDIIGDFLTEINVTSPTGVREIDNIFSMNVSSLFFDVITKNLELKKKEKADGITFK